MGFVVTGTITTNLGEVKRLALPRCKNIPFWNRWEAETYLEKYSKQQGRRFSNLKIEER